jgi:hypothetical protein
MANPGTFQTYDLNVGIKLDIENLIRLIDPFDVPFQGGYGADGLTALSHDQVFETKIQWLDENLLTPKTTAAATAGTTATYLTLAAGTGVNFQTGDLIQVDGEQMNVTGYGTTADTLLVGRSFNSTTAVTVATGDTIIGIGSVLAEGSAPPNARAKDRSNRQNYTQIFGPIAVQVSGTEQVVQKYGLTGTEFDHQLANRAKELNIQVEQALVNGIASAGSGTVGRTMGGMNSFITSNVDSSTTSFTDAALLAQLANCFNAGGRPDRLAVGTKSKYGLSGLNSTNIRYQQTTDARGQAVDFYVSDFGRTSIVLNRWLLVNQAFLFSRDQATISVLRPTQFEMLAKTGDNVQGMIVCEKSFKFRVQSHAAKFTALT